MGFGHLIREIRQLPCEKYPVLDSTEAVVSLMDHQYIKLVIY
jgi:hypothetical protein